MANPNPHTQEQEDLKIKLSHQFYGILGIKKQERDEIESYIDSLDSNGTLSPENKAKLDLIDSYADKILSMNKCKKRNIDEVIYGKTIDNIKSSITSLNDINRFIDEGIANQNDGLKQLIDNMNNCYVTSICDNLGITDDSKKVNFENADFNTLANLAQIIDFIKAKEPTTGSQQDKDALNNLLEEIEGKLTTDYSAQQPPVDITKEFNKIYGSTVRKLNTILRNGNVKDDNGNVIDTFSKGRASHNFNNLNAQIDDMNDQIGFNNIDHPMRYLLEDLETRRSADSQKFGDGKPYNVNVSEQDPAGWRTTFNGQSYKMGDASKVGVFDRNTWNLLSGTLNSSGTKMTIAHDKDKNMTPLAFQASINATVESMKKNFAPYSNNPNNFQFNLKLKSESPATCQVMFEELFKYAEAQQAQQATPEQTGYNERFKYFKDIYINDIKLDMNIFNNAQEYTNQQGDLDKSMFAAKVYKYLEDALQTKQQNSNGNTPVQLTEKEQLMQTILQQRNAGGRS